MQKTLTIRLDDTLIALAKAYAARSGGSVSSIVADYFALLGAPDTAVLLDREPHAERAAFLIVRAISD